MNSMRLAWLQLSRVPSRLLTALLGVSVAVILMMMQLGFKDALFVSAVRIYEVMDYDVLLVSPKTTFVVRSVPFARRRLFQARSVSGVADVTPLYTSGGLFRDPALELSRQIFVIGAKPDGGALRKGGSEMRELIKTLDFALFDSLSRPAYGDLSPAIAAGQSPEVEINGRRIQAVGHFRLGTSFGIDGTLLASDETFHQLFPGRSAGQIDFGLIRAEAGIDAATLSNRIRAILPEDVLVLTREEIVAREQAYWSNTTPIGYVFTFGTIMGVVVGSIIVYQILYAGVVESLPRYATLRATGYSNGYLVRVLSAQGIILSVLGFIPGLVASYFLYDVAGDATRLPLVLTTPRTASVLLLTIAMCLGSSLYAARRLRSADPAELF